MSNAIRDKENGMSKNRLHDHPLDMLAAAAKGEVSVEEAQAAVRDEGARMLRQAEGFVRENPALCLGIAAACGLAFGWWMKRR
jgi:ElaB/YqjD/DUF883 family membrane-anchored ribosome-binding protein